MRLWPKSTLSHLPGRVLDGNDPQLERGVAEVMKKIQSDPKAFPKRPEPPVRPQGQ